MAQQMFSKLHEPGLEVLPHLSNSPDLAAIDFYFFQSFENSLAGKQFNIREAVQKDFEEFIGFYTPGFCKMGIEKLPLIEVEMHEWCIFWLTEIKNNN